MRASLAVRDDAYRIVQDVNLVPVGRRAAGGSESKIGVATGTDHPDGGRGGHRVHQGDVGDGIERPPAAGGRRCVRREGDVELGGVTTAPSGRRRVDLDPLSRAAPSITVETMETEALAWPNGARLAVMVTVMFEAWPEGKAPPYSPMASPLREGTVDRLGISWADYAGKTGIWRLLRMLDQRGIQGTVAANARAVERFPEAANEIVRRGHEIAGHGYTQDRLMPYYTPAEERELIGKCADIIAQATGARPVGWASPRMTPTEHTAALLAERGFIWHGDYHDTDRPYVVSTAKGRIVALQHSDFTDNRVLRASPRDFFQVYQDTFDFLYRTEPASIINLTVHAHFGARPPLAAMLAAVLEYMQRHAGVWFARHDEVAAWVMQQGAAR